MTLSGNVLRIKSKDKGYIFVIWKSQYYENKASNITVKWSRQFPECLAVSP